jgi:1-acyl-sn-glycerol-3-phosphate acyltransferase
MPTSWSRQVTRIGLLAGRSDRRLRRLGIRDELRLLRHGRDWRGRSTVPRSAEPWVPDVAEPEFPTAWARSPLAVAMRAGLTRSLLKAVVWSQTAPVVQGTAYLDGLRGPAVFVANHSSHLDTPLILGSLPPRFANRVAVGAAADYFFDVRWRAITTAFLFNAFPVERYRSRRLRSLAAELVDEGWSLLLYPEGTRSEDGWMHPFRVGAAHLCVAKGLPVVPISISGSYAAMPRGRGWPQPGRPRIAIRYGRPMHPREGEKAGEFRDRMVEAVARLAAEEELGWYGALRAVADGALDIPGYGTGRATAAQPHAIAGATPALSTRGAPAARWRRIWASTKPSSSPGQRPRH